MIIFSSPCSIGGQLSYELFFYICIYIAFIHVCAYIGEGFSGRRDQNKTHSRASASRLQSRVNLHSQLIFGPRGSRSVLESICTECWCEFIAENRRPGRPADPAGTVVGISTRLCCEILPQCVCVLLHHLVGLRSILVGIIKEIIYTHTPIATFQVPVPSSQPLLSSLPKAPLSIGKRALIFLI